MTLTEFLLARIAEDEHLWTLAHEARLAFVVDGPDRVAARAAIPAVPPSGFAARMLAECDAKRRLLDWCAPVSGAERVPTDRPGVYDHRDVRYVNEDGEDVLRLLALPYVDHSDYRTEWKP